jgi:integrase
MNDEIKVLVKSNGGNRCLVMYYVDPVSGLRVVKTTGTTDQREAERKAGDWEKEVRAETYHVSSKITWKEFRDKYEAEYMPTLANSSQGNFATAFNHLERELKPNRLAKLTTAAMSSFQAKLRQPKETIKDGKRIILPPIKETTIAGILRHLKAALRWAEKQGMIKAPRFIMPKAARGILAKGRPITTEEYERMLSVAEKVRPRETEKWRRLLTGMWLSGLRLSEAVSLSWDYEAPFRIDLTGRRPVFVIQAAAQKSRRDEILPMTPDFAEWLEATYPEGKRQGKVFNLRFDPNRLSAVISAIGNAAGVVVNKADGKFASAHDFRRSFGNRWAKKVMPAVLQRLMRHADIQTTMSYYVNINAEDIADDLWAAHEREKTQNGNTCGNTRVKKPIFSRKKRV